MPGPESEPLRSDMILPNGHPLRWDTPGARWDGTVAEVNRAAIALTDLVYNMVRFEQIERLGLRNWRAA